MKGFAWHLSNAFGHVTYSHYSGEKEIHSENAPLNLFALSEFSHSGPSMGPKRVVGLDFNYCQSYMPVRSHHSRVTGPLCCALVQQAAATTDQTVNTLGLGAVCSLSHSLPLSPSLFLLSFPFFFFFFPIKVKNLFLH